MREDLAEEKVYLEQQLQKDYKKAIQKYNKERVEREEENQKWISKYDNMVCEFEEKIDQIEGSHQLASVKIKEELSKTYSYR